MEADGESPWEACQREVREETGLEVSRGRLAAMDFRPAKPGRLAGIRYLFDCGQVSDEELAGAKLQPEEISDSRLVPLPEALNLLRGPISRRVQSATQGYFYLEDGRPV
jgi:8-oxo-dGTP pyrophosphatase MutT (NUDIX family)